MVYKMNESIIVIQAEATSPNRTNVVFWSHDRGTAKLRMKLVRKNGIPQSLPEGTTVPIRLMFKSATAEGGYGKHDYLATVEDPVNGIVSIVLEDNILGYVGTVEGSVYIDFPNDRSLDTAGRFTFYIKRSPIDESTPELEDYYFNGFSQTIDKVEKILADGKQEIDEKVAESETQIDAKLKDTNDKITKANQDVSTLNTNIDKANARIDQTDQQIGDLGKLKKMYSNSIEFGDYDYSGNINLLSKQFIAENITGAGTGFTVTQVDDSVRIGRTTDVGGRGYALFIGNLSNNTQYTLSYDILLENGASGPLGDCNVGLEGLYNNTPNYMGIFYCNNITTPDVWQKVTMTFNSGPNMEMYENFRFRAYYGNGTILALKIKNVKIERGSIATSYQPNLMITPYYLSKLALGENLAPNSGLPTANSNQLITEQKLSSYLVKGETYTVTLEGTKPANQGFSVFIADVGNTKFGNMTPVEGLTNQWELTFTYNKDTQTRGTKLIRIYQRYSELGSCTIKWLKIEKGDTRTPNISQFKYFGEGLKDSNNPNDYSWDITPEYTEKGLNDSVSLTEPETVLGLKNFEDGLQIAGKEVAIVPEDTGWVNLTAINGHSWNKQGQIRRIGKLVMFRGSLKGSTLSTQDFCTIPEGFRPSNPTDNYEYQFLLPPQSSNTLDNGGMAYIRPNGVCGLPSFRGTVNLFLTPIQYYID
ncbi:BppU family phage baseplate upper protein [Enterococcus faecium]|nr:BppU family phage baseplate upper protein [Enterococcus faecium]